MLSLSSFLRRAGSTVVLLVHVCAFAVWPAFDPGVHAPTVPHIEAPGGARCPAAHDPAHCPICQASTLHLGAVPAAPLNLALAGATHESAPTPDAPIRRLVERHPCSRSPPVMPA